MLIDCADCSMRDLACGDCVVTFLIGPPDRVFEPVEQAALAALAGGGLVPPLRMVPGGVGASGPPEAPIGSGAAPHPRRASGGQSGGSEPRRAPGSASA